MPTCLRSLRFLALGALCACLPLSAWAQHRGGVLRGEFPGHPPLLSLPDESPRPDLRAGMAVPPHNVRETQTACINEVPRDRDDQILSVQQIDFGGRIQCRVKIMRNDGMIQVLTGELAP